MLSRAVATRGSSFLCLIGPLTVYSPLGDVAFALTMDENMTKSRHPVLIGLHGRAGSGKDTIGDYMKNSWMFGKMSFAGPLKDASSRLWGVPRTVFETPGEKEQVNEYWKVSPRHMAQWLGTEVMRKQFDEDFFLKRAAFTLDNDSCPRCMVVTDVRYDNEARFIKERGGYIWRIEGRHTAMDPVQGAHASEKGIDPSLVDATVDNSGAMETTFEEIDNHLHSLPEF